LACNGTRRATNSLRGGSACASEGATGESKGRLPSSGRAMAGPRCLNYDDLHPRLQPSSRNPLPEIGLIRQRSQYMPAHPSLGLPLGTRVAASEHQHEPSNRTDSK
jgi:hypothetical protein